MIAISSDTPAPLDSVESFFDIVWEDAVALDAAEHNSSCSTRSPITTTYCNTTVIVILVCLYRSRTQQHDTRLRSPASELSVPPDLKAKSIRYSHQIMS